MAKTRARIGIKGIPIEKGYSAVDYYFHYDLDKKDIAKLAKAFVNKNYSKEDRAAILANAEWNFNTYTGIMCAAWCMDNNVEFPEKYARYPEEVKTYFNGLLLKGKGLLRTKEALEALRETKKVYTPQQRLQMKINDTVMRDIDTLEDEWYDGKKTDLDIVAKMRINELKGMAVNPVVEYIKRILPEYEDAHSGECKEAKDAYKHLGKRELSRRIKVLNGMIDSLMKYKESQKSLRKKRKTKA